MTFTKRRFCLFFSLVLTEHDWQNLAASRVRLVMLPLSLAASRPEVCRRMREMGCTLVLRVEEGTYSDGDAPARIGGECVRVQNVCPVEAVIVGVEPENGVAFTYGQDWQKIRAYEHRAAFDRVRVGLQLRGFRVVAPGWTKRSISEDDPPQPARTTWREICTQPQESEHDQGGVSFGYHSAQGVGWHEYQHGWLGFVDELRLKFSLKQAQELWHLPLWIDELGVNTGSQVERMRAYIDIAEMLLSHRLGRRIEMLAPFISNGDPGSPPHWDARFILRDPVAYRLLGDWMAAE